MENIRLALESAHREAKAAYKFSPTAYTHEALRSVGRAIQQIDEIINLVQQRLAA